MKIKIGKKIIYLRLRVVNINKDNVTIGLNSGIAFRGSHYLFLDMDNRELSSVENEVKEIMSQFWLKRGLIIESSPKRYQFVSFTPIPYERMLYISSLSSEDVNHKGHTIKNGFSTIRVIKKNINDKSQIKIIKELENPDGDQFYNYDAEKSYRKVLEEF